MTNQLPDRVRVTPEEMEEIHSFLAERKRLMPVERTGIHPPDAAKNSWEGALRYAALEVWQDAPWLVIFGGLAWVGVLLL